MQNINSTLENTYGDGHVAVALRTLIKKTARRMLGFAGGREHIEHSFGWRHILPSHLCNRICQQQIM